MTRPFPLIHPYQTNRQMRSAHHACVMIRLCGLVGAEAETTDWIGEPPLEFFNRIVSESMNHVSFGAHVLHTDTTNFSLHGAYENSNPDPKDNRWDLKRFVLRIDGDLRNISYK